MMAALVILFAGCEGEEGPTGPSGDDGNANVVTGTISPTNEEWLWNSTFWYRWGIGSSTGYFTRYVDITVEEITADVISTGVVLVSFKAEPGYPGWTSLPFHFPGMDWTYVHTIAFEVSEGLIRLHYFNIPNQSGASLPDLMTWEIPTYPFKYTVIGGTAIEEMAASGVDVTDHKQVMEFLR
jgi:hypothetical protein